MVRFREFTAAYLQSFGDQDAQCEYKISELISILSLLKTGAAHKRGTHASPFQTENNPASE